jgi:hypothetical protein
VHGALATGEALSDERKQYAVFLLIVRKERADVANLS